MALITVTLPYLMVIQGIAEVAGGAGAVVDAEVAGVVEVAGLAEGVEVAGARFIKLRYFVILAPL